MTENSPATKSAQPANTGRASVHASRQQLPTFKTTKFCRPFGRLVYYLYRPDAEAPSSSRNTVTECPAGSGGTPGFVQALRRGKPAAAEETPGINLAPIVRLARARNEQPRGHGDEQEPRRSHLKLSLSADGLTSTQSTHSAGNYYANQFVGHASRVPVWAASRRLGVASRRFGPLPKQVGRGRPTHRQASRLPPRRCGPAQAAPFLVGEFFTRRPRPRGRSRRAGRSRAASCRSRRGC